LVLGFGFPVFGSGFWFRFLVAGEEPATENETQNAKPKTQNQNGQRSLKWSQASLAEKSA
jgi:hypothetical protein